MNTAHTRGYAYIAAVLYAAIIGLSFLFVKMTVTVAHPIDVLAHRFALSLIVVSIPVVLGWIKIRLSLRDLWRIIPLGLLSPVLFLPFKPLDSSRPTHRKRVLFRLWPLFSLSFSLLSS